MEAIGRRTWVIADGYIPGWSRGPDPQMTSHESFSVLNAGEAEAHLEVTIFFTDREPAGPFALEIAPRRTRHVKFNDLTDRDLLPLATEYAAVVASDVPVVVQHTRLDSRQAENAVFSTIAFGT